MGKGGIPLPVIGCKLDRRITARKNLIVRPFPASDPAMVDVLHKRSAVRIANPKLSILCLVPCFAYISICQISLVHLNMSCTIDFINQWELRYQGAESRLYFGSHNGNQCVIKHRFPKKYRHPLLDKKLTKERTKRERRIIEKISERSKLLGEYMPKVAWSDSSTILMSEIKSCETLYDFMTRKPGEAKSLVPLIGQCIAELHNLGVIHGDLTTSNLLIVPRHSSENDTSSKRMKVADSFHDSHIVIPIDFGLSTGSTHPEERSVDLYVLERAFLSTFYSDSGFFNLILEHYLENIDESTCEPLGKDKIVERLHEVRARGRKSDYAAASEA